LRRLQAFRFDYVCSGTTTASIPGRPDEGRVGQGARFFDTLTWSPPTHLPTGEAIPAARIQERDRRVAKVRADFFATLARESA